MRQISPSQALHGPCIKHLTKPTFTLPTSPSEPASPRFTVVGRPRLRYKNCLERNLKACNIDINSWETAAADRYLWRHNVHNSTKLIDNELERKHQERKDRRSTAQIAVANALKCEIINVCYADTGFCQTALSLFNVMEHPQVRETST